MNKLPRYSFMVVILVVLAILGSWFVIASGCCFYQSNCEADYPYDQDTCEDQDGTYDSDDNCANIDQCRLVCCCEGSTAHPDTYEVVCENNGWTSRDPIVVSDPADCTTYCTQTQIPNCDENCQPNSEDCFGVDGQIVNNPNPSNDFYYCGIDDTTYTTQTSCTTACVEPIEDCDPDSTISADSPCICEEEERTSGYCCPSGLWKESGDDCLRNDCTNLGHRCVSGCSGTHYSNHDNANSATGCPTDKPLCCDEEAPAYSECCHEDYESCTGTVYTDYIYPDCNADTDPYTQPCSDTCERFDCSKGNWKINSGANSHPTLTYCYCDGDYRDTSTDTGYCCDDDSDDGAYQTSSCITETGSISGYVYDTSDDSGIEGATVRATISGNTMGTDSTDSDGNYILEGLSYGIYKISASKEGFLSDSIENVVLADTELTGQDIGLEPYVEGECDSSSPPRPVVTTNHVKGEAVVDLEWTLECSNYNEFIIKRSPAHPLGEIKTDNLFFTDENVSWGQTYTYYVRAHYITNALSDWYDVEITLGDEECEGVLDNEFCSDDRASRNTCDETNSFSSSSCVLEEDEGYVCTGPDEDGETECVYKPGNCKEIEPFKPFGLYYEKDNCLIHEEKVLTEDILNWCYYDYSSTTIDKCNDCDELDDCYGYLSEDACLVDNCGAGGVYVSGGATYNNGCEWMYLWEELGKGICYDPDFEGKECSLCNNDDGVFYNVYCSQEVCSALGSCYSSSDSCEECSDEWGSRTTCETYETKESCIGADEQAIDFDKGSCSSNIPVEIIPSNDACGLGVCKWSDSIGCYKDANDDDGEDCSENVCKKDLKAPVTTPQADIPNMNDSGYSINFTAYDDAGESSNAESFYFCVDNSDSCCPTNEIPFDMEWSVFVNPVDYLGDYVEAGIYYIRYYSIDDHYNVEEVKSLGVYIDKDPPPTDLDYIVESETETTSSLDITLSSEEFIECSYVTDLPDDKIVEGTDEFIEDRISKTFGISYNNLEDGLYHFTTTCYDDVGNEDVTPWEILVDTVQQVRNPSPSYETLDYYDVELYVETSDSSVCTATGTEGYTGAIVLDQTGEQNNFVHTHSDTSFDDGTYHFDVSCAPDQGVRQPDSTLISFTVDTTAPTTAAKEDDEAFDFTVWHKTPLTIKLECGDVDLGSAPGEFGCNDDTDIRYCLGEFCEPVYNTESPYLAYVDSDSSIDFRYYSVDGGGNEETRNDKRILIDNEKPTLNINSIDSVVNTDTITISGTYFDNYLSGVKEVIITVIDDETSDFTTYTALLLSGDSFSYNVNLYAGSNTILIAPEDNAGNQNEYERSTYYDTEGPEITAGVFDSEGYKIDNNYNERIAEYGDDVIFNSSITDVAGVDRAQVTIECGHLDTSCSGYTTTTYVLEEEEGGYYDKVVSETLPVGNYTATFKAWDDFDLSSEEELWFIVNDTSPITLYLDPDVEDGKTVYYEDLELTGISEPDILVKGYLCNERCSSCVEKVSTTGGAVSEPKGDFEDKRLGDLVVSAFPKEGDSYLLWTGQLGGLENDYLRFSTHDTSYLITDVSTQKIGQWQTELTISPAMEEDVQDPDSTVSAYETDKPTGWFELTGIKLVEGDNCIIVSGENTDTGNTAENIYKHITYEASDLNIVQKTPEFNEVIYDSSIQSITIEVETDYAASCTITNAEADKIAGEFTYTMAKSSGDMTHYIVFSDDDCKNPVGSGPFCYIKNDESTSGGIYYKYRVDCEPAEGIEMESDSEEICFGVETWGMIQTEHGLNLCDEVVNECSGSFPSECVSSCSTVCSGKECGDDGCGGTCPPGCGSGESCVDGQCESCSTVCSGKECGDDGCGGTCGSCGSGEECQSGLCIVVEGGAGGVHD